MMLFVTMALAGDVVPCDKPADKALEAPVSVLMLPAVEPPVESVLVLPAPAAESPPEVAAPATTVAVVPATPPATPPAAAPKDESCKVKPKR